MMDEKDLELDERLALLRDVAEPAHADKQRLRAELRATLRPRPPSAYELASGASPGGAQAVIPSGQRRRAGVPPLLPWVGGACIGAIITLGIVILSNPVPGTRNAAPASSGRTPSAPIEKKAITTGTVRVVPPVGLSASEEHALAADGSAGSLGITHAAAPMQGARNASPAPPELGLAAVLEQLHGAERALYAGDAARALGILSDLDGRAEPALLREERLTTRVLALCQAERVEEALGARRQLEREIPSSIYARRLDQSCAVDREPR